MHRFDGYTSVVYDTQCVIYQCFNTELPSVTGEQIPINDGKLTDLIIEASRYFKKKGYKVRFLSCCDKEITEKLISQKIIERASDQKLLARLGCGELYPTIRLQLQERFFKKFNKLKKTITLVCYNRRKKL